MKASNPFAAMLSELVDRFGHNDSPEDLECLDRARVLLGESIPVTLTFVPQAWVNDYAVEVDAQGPLTWQVPFTDLKGIKPDSNPSDELHRDKAAPKWVRDWSGPFYVTWDEEQVDGLLAALAEREASEAKLNALIETLEIATNEGNTEVDETQEDAETIKAWIARQGEQSLRDHIEFRAEQAKLALLNYRA